MATEEKLLTVQEFAERARVTEVTVYRWIRSGQIPVVRLGERIVRVPESALAARARVRGDDTEAL